MKGATMNNLTNRIPFILTVLALGAGVVCAQSQAQNDAAKNSSLSSHKIEMPGTKQWIDTGIDVRGGAKLRRLHIRPINPTVES
jgi:hypothetical protein